MLLGGVQELPFRLGGHRVCSGAGLTGEGPFPHRITGVKHLSWGSRLPGDSDLVAVSLCM